MAKFLTALTDPLTAFIRAQHLFFVATAAAEGRINLSPKGIDTFRVLGPTRVGYLDLTGSGNETAAHLRHDGRLTFMFCAFTGPAMILRLYGAGQVVAPGTAAWEELRPAFGPPLAGERQLVLMDIDTLQTSCGSGVPLFRHEGARDTLLTWAERKGHEGLAAYREANNRVSIDGLPITD